MYHLRIVTPGSEESAEIEKDFGKGFVVDSIVKVQNRFTYTSFCVKRQEFEFQLSEEGGANEVTLYHVSKGSPHDLSNEVSFFHGGRCFP
jgi:hypothetical protein